MIKNIITIISTLAICIVALASSVVYLMPTPMEDNFGATSLPIAGATYNLAGSGITGSATSITLQSLTIVQTGQFIVDSDLPDVFYITLEPGSKSRQEIASCTTITQNASSATLSGCERGLSPVTPYTASTTMQFSHGGGTRIIFSDPPQLFNLYPSKGNTEIITGDWTFDRHPEATSTLGVPTTSSQYVTVELLNNTANQGAATATEAFGGISELATQKETASSTPWGVLVPHVIQSKYATSTPAADRQGLFVVVTENDGFLSQLFLDLTEAFSFSNFTSASTTNTGNILNTGNATSTGSSIFAGLLNVTGDSLFVNSTTSGTFNIATTTGQLCFGDASETVDCKSKFGVDYRKSTYWEFDISPADNFSETSMAIDAGKVYTRFTSSGSNASANGVLPGTGSDNTLQGDDTLTVEISTRVHVDDTTNEHCIGLGSTDQAFYDPDYIASSHSSALFCYDGAVFLTRTMSNNQAESIDISGITLTNWNLLTLVWDGTDDTVRFYVNGTLVSTHTTTTPNFAVSMRFGVGSDATSDEISFNDVKVRYKF